MGLGWFSRAHNVYFWVRNTSTRSKFQKNASKWHFLSKNRFSKLVHKRKLNGTLVWALSSKDRLPMTNLHKTWSNSLVSRSILAYSTFLYLKNWLRYGENKKKASKKTNIHAGTYKGITMAHLSGFLAQKICSLWPIYMKHDEIHWFQGVFWHIVRFCILKIDWDMEKTKKKFVQKNKYPHWYI